MISGISVIIRIIFSAILGGAIGLEREVYGHEAGLRTHILVSVGSALIMLTSLFVFDIYKDVATVDPSRIASSVVTGVGFLGAGAIIRYGMAVKGLTTAASLWITSAVGLAVGCGFYLAAIFSTIIVLIVLLVLRNIEKTVLKKKSNEDTAYGTK